ncbi:helix-turn-helix domain-containing protein [Goodfellowiella coeruleoviolacea]|uniref:Helix-turn-helix domain-containing protein n=1 Tax=Goodfellowiella coeruleoviolacea TaxID=334858 RepID=A0AAE3GH34_9PSEU|nr:helix-turn-helix domain-containing protein [Goodfellowiella coeruleoviolacea]MCP2168116.1 Helix-turn-helix domain-containing protein [Goodfellowiella coeruleoviolacea]
MTPEWIADSGQPHVEVPTAIFPELTVGLPAARVYGALAREADPETGVVVCSLRKLAEDIGMSRSQVVAGRRKLREAGWITVMHEEPGGPVLYRMHTAPQREESVP